MKTKAKQLRLKAHIKDYEETMNDPSIGQRRKRFRKPGSQKK